MNSHGTLASPPIDSATRGNLSLHKVKVICWMVCQVTSHLSCCHRRGGVHFIIQAQPEFQLSAIYGLTFTECVKPFAARLKKRWGEDSEEKASRCWLSPHKGNFRANRKWNSLVFFTCRKEKLIHLFLQFNFIYIAFLTIKIISMHLTKNVISCRTGGEETYVMNGNASVRICKLKRVFCF